MFFIQDNISMQRKTRTGFYSVNMLIGTGPRLVLSVMLSQRIHTKRSFDLDKIFKMNMNTLHIVHY